jgi:Na+/phosphate symporter
VKAEHTDIYNKVKNHLVSPPHRIPRQNPIFDQYSNHLLDYLHHCYSTPLSYKDQLQTLEQAQIMRSIRKVTKNVDLIIRVTDKGHHFYIGLTSEFENKVEQFFSDTNAFMELSYNPFNEILDKVVQLLDKLQSKKLILQWQFKEMTPDVKTAELAHLYFNPKTHKV